jgi:methionine--tRNA ligase beta chain
MKKRYVSTDTHQDKLQNTFSCDTMRSMKPIITYDDFAKLDLRVGTVINCAEKEGSDKLLRLTVDFGEEGTRNILSGIKKWYKPADLIDKQFVFVFNLAPRKVMGEDSEGMILAAEGAASKKLVPLGGEKKPLPLKPKSKVPNGAKIL